MEYPINVSPDDLPLDIELHNVDDLPAVIRAIQQCSIHIECQQSPLNIISVDDIANHSINPAPTPFNSRQGQTEPSHNVAIERKVSKLVAEWYENIDEFIGNNKLPELEGLIVNLMVGSGAGDLCIENERLSAQLQAALKDGDAAFAVLHAHGFERSGSGWVFKGSSFASDGGLWYKVPDARVDALRAQNAVTESFEALAQEYEVREIRENASAVGYMRERIQQLEAEKNQLAQMLHAEKNLNGSLIAMHSNQKADLEKLFDIISGWGWSGDNWSEWLQVYVETVIKNCASLNDRLAMRSGELQADIDIKNEVLAENKKLVAENSQLRREHGRISDERDSHRQAAYDASSELAKKERSYDRLNAKYQKLRERTKV